MQISSDEVHIWVAQLQANDETIAHYEALLNEAESIKANRFHFEKHRTRYKIAHGFLRTVLSLYLDLPAKDISFAFKPNGKPYIENSRIHFNLSHSEDKAVYAFAHSEVGVDIELINDTYNSDVAARYFSPDENARINKTNPEQQAAEFYRIWSRKEALIKASGKDLSMGSEQFSTLAEKVTLDAISWHLIDLDILNNFSCSLVINPSIQTLSYYELTALNPPQAKMVSY